MLKLQYRPRVLQHLHACKLRAVWQIYTQNTRHACKILHEQLNARCVYLSLEKFPQISSLTFTRTLQDVFKRLGLNKVS